MKCATSFFDRGVFIKSVLRFWPIWAIYAFVWMLVLPASLIDVLARAPSDAARIVLQSVEITAAWLCPLAACGAECIDEEGNRLGRGVAVADEPLPPIRLGLNFASEEKSRCCVARPAMPSSSRPFSRWKSTTACVVPAPKRPSMRPS